LRHGARASRLLQQRRKALRPVPRRSRPHLRFRLDRIAKRREAMSALLSTPRRHRRTSLRQRQSSSLASWIAWRASLKKPTSIMTMPGNSWAAAHRGHRFHRRSRDFGGSTLAAPSGAAGASRGWQIGRNLRDGSRRSAIGDNLLQFGQTRAAIRSGVERFPDLFDVRSPA